MDTALLVARMLLAAVFLVAGLAKLADRAGSRQAIQEFGLPAFLARPLGTLLPLVELTIALALIPTISAWWGAIGACALLLLFVAGIGLNLIKGRTPDCHCFGQLHSAPVGRLTLARNGVLVVVASFVVWQGQTNAGVSALSWIGALTVAQSIAIIVGAAIMALLVAEGWFLVQLLRQQGRLLVRFDAVEARLLTNGMAPAPGAVAASQQAAGLPVGTPAPPFALSGLYGETLTLGALLAFQKPVLLIFSDPGCGPCTALLPDIGRWQREYAPAFTVVLISRGTPETNRTKVAVHGVTHVLLQQDRELAQAYQANGTPVAVVVRPDGTVGSPVVPGPDAVRNLVAQMMNQPTPVALAPAATANGANHTGDAAGPSMPPSLRIGDPAPALALADYSGKTVNLADFHGHQILVVFWNPGCGFCQQMLPDLLAWESNPPKGAPHLLVVSTGTSEESRAMGLQAPVVLDPALTTGRLFGATGTPMAVLVDADVKIASGVAAGAQAVLALAGYERDRVDPGKLLA